MKRPARATVQRERARPVALPATLGVALLAVTAAAALVACGGGSSDADFSDDASTVTSATAGSTSTAGVQCAYAHSAYNAASSVNLTSTAVWSCATAARTLAANGVPDHTVGTFPNADNPNAIRAQAVTATFTLTPAATGTATQLGGPRGPIGFVLNGVKIDAGTNGGCNDAGTVCDPGTPAGQWRIEALGQNSFKFGTDASNAHVQPDGAYHYHGMPEGFIASRGGDTATMTLIGWAADGFPIYARYGYSVAGDAKSAIQRMTGSYRLKATPDTSRPAVTLYAMGTFTQDYEYVAGSGDLDECNGRTGVTPEFPGGIYHYFATDTYPFLQRCVKGAV